MEIVSVIREMSEKINGELRHDAMIDNPTDNPLVDAYNDGIDAMCNQVLSYLNNLALGYAFGTEVKQ